ncbi:MAG: efflux RND transporter periplasmic adaptor subunit [Labilibaculum sp.]|nr:efflux RND transporter periplasmic adaptor subunit [Labilibaculum sp.]
MKKPIKIAVYTLVSLAICILVSLQLKSNKESNAQVAQMADISGEFYPVKAQLIKETKLTTKITTTGFLESETDLVVLSETRGTIKAIYKNKGNYVSAGEVIARVDDELLEAQLSATKAAYEQVQKEEKRFAKLLAENAVPSQQYEEIKLNLETTRAQYITARRQLEDTKIKAPVSGYIEEKFIEIGQFIGSGDEICNIIDPKNLKLKIFISEHNYKNIKLGQKIEINSSVYPENQFEGKVSFLSKKAGAGNSFDAEIKIKNTQNLLKPGMFVSANIMSEHDDEGIYIPRKAVNGSLKDACVYTIVKGKAVVRKITIGNAIDKQVQVLNGLKPGDKLIVEGNYSIFDGAVIKVID